MLARDTVMAGKWVYAPLEVAPHTIFVPVPTTSSAAGCGMSEVSAGTAHEGNISRAAASMGVSRQLLHRLIERHGIRAR